MTVFRVTYLPIHFKPERLMGLPIYLVIISESNVPIFEESFMLHVGAQLKHLLNINYIQGKCKLNFKRILLNKDFCVVPITESHHHHRRWRYILNPLYNTLEYDYGVLGDVRCILFLLHIGTTCSSSHRNKLGEFMYLRLYSRHFIFFSWFLRFCASIQPL